MKKIISISIFIMLLLSLFGCTYIKPEEKTQDFLSAVKTQNKDVLMGYANNEYINLLINSSGDEETLNKIYTNLFKNLDYKILSVSIDDKNNTATVKTQITNVNFEDAIKSYEKKSYSYIVDNLYSSSKTKNSNLNKQCLKILSDVIEDTSKSKEKNTVTTEIKLNKNENHSYDLVIDDTLMNALTGNILNLFD